MGEGGGSGDGLAKDGLLRSARSARASARAGSSSGGGTRSVRPTAAGEREAPSNV